MRRGTKAGGWTLGFAGQGEQSEFGNGEPQLVLGRE